MDSEDPDPSVNRVMSGVQQMSLDLNDIDHDNGDRHSDTEDEFDPNNLPRVVIVTHIADQVFDNDDIKTEFESLFRYYDPTANVTYLKSFRRARIEFETPILAAEARIRFTETEFYGAAIKCFFAQPLKSIGASPHLQLPAPVKQFLISPPSSPPVGWEPAPEAHPVINYELIQAIATLSPGEAHELHPPSDQHPGIIVHICEDPEGFLDRPKVIQQTKRPNVHS